MMIELVLVGVVVLAGGLAAGPSGRGPETRLRRRRRVLHRHAERATVADLEMLLAGAFPRPVVRPLVNRIRRGHLEPAALWRWAEANGATALALALCAEFGATDFAEPTTEHDGFDPQSLRLLAELNGEGLGALVLARLDARSTPVPRTRAA
ncbi:hypothetical protein [Nocardioides sp.]|uniref:hypothetical protein n=1 Tax=Nocardioides sp. TaxID=35761 RepID=UPI00378316AE